MLTEAFEKWIKSQQGEASSFNLTEAHFWLRAFVWEIENRSKVFAAVQPGCEPNFVDISDAFAELVREFGLECDKVEPLLAEKDREIGRLMKLETSLRDDLQRGIELEVTQHRRIVELEAENKQLDIERDAQCGFLIELEAENAKLCELLERSQRYLPWDAVMPDGKRFHDEVKAILGTIVVP